MSSGLYFCPITEVVCEEALLWAPSPLALPAQSLSPTSTPITLSPVNSPLCEPVTVPHHSPFRVRCLPSHPALVYCIPEAAAKWRQRVSGCDLFLIQQILLKDKRDLT